MDKILVKESCLNKLNSQIEELRNILNQILIATSTDSKSSAGDKHETSVSMAQLEQEKLTNQINIQQKNYEALLSINALTKNTDVRLGSVIETSIGWLYIAIGIGKFTCNNQEIFAISPSAPLSQSILFKEKNQSIIFNEKIIEIINIY
jgi:hypothetical protein